MVCETEQVYWECGGFLQHISDISGGDFVVVAIIIIVAVIVVVVVIHPMRPENEPQKY